MQRVREAAVRTVWKYQLEWTADPQTLRIPYRSMVLLGPHIAVQHEKLCLWAEVETDDDPREYTFLIRGTGHEVPDSADYLGSALTEGGHFVWHVFLLQ
jgi:hypothetical protein